MRKGDTARYDRLGAVHKVAGRGADGRIVRKRVR
jgi:hypothetical protein